MVRDDGISSGKERYFKLYRDSEHIGNGIGVKERNFLFQPSPEMGYMFF